MRELIDGSTAIVRGALDAGCDFFAGYPITPASPILMALMEDLPRLGGIAVQGEDEIASIGMCIGAAMAGARAMTATSGPGISLYSENLGLAIMGEVPLVVVDVQRLGPATGGATTVGQGDVQMVRWGTSGGYPVIVLAPSSVAEGYRLTRRAFALARRFRCPVFLLADKELALTLQTVELGSAGGGEPSGRREAAPPASGSAETESSPGAEGETPPRPYRYRPADGVPPLRPFGDVAGIRFTGSTHDEGAVITKDPTTVEALNRHLLAKVEEHRDEIEDVEADLQEGARTLVVSYGVTAGAVREAVARVRRAAGPSPSERPSETGGTPPPPAPPPVSALTVASLWPVPETALASALEGVTRVVVAELNPGLYRREIERLAGDREVVGVHRLDGRPLTPEQILEALP